MEWKPETLRQATAADDAYDLVIWDMQMPEMLAQAIRERGVLTSTHLLLLISRGKRHETSVPKVAGILNCLVKPVKQSDLNDALVNILGNVTLSPQSLAEQRIMSTALVKPQTKRLRVLVAEDNVVNQKIALKQLQKLGCNADGVASGIEAIAALDRIPYDAVLMDCQMPEMDGYAATQQIRKHGNKVRIIAMTANAMEDDRKKCFQAGMDDYISKPVRLGDLSAALTRGEQIQAEQVARQNATTGHGEVVDLIDEEFVKLGKPIQPARANNQLTPQTVG
jgi:CheY-like chemotaxis protein